MLKRRTSLAPLALLIPVLAGIAWMSIADAPMRFIAMNAGAVIIALAAWRWLPFPRGQAATLALAIALVGLLAITALAGVESDGVRRWLRLGPISLHTGYLVLPLLIVLSARLQPAIAAALLIAAGAMCTVQPDRATVLALGAALAARLVIKHDWFTIAALIAAGAGLVTVWSTPDQLAPVPFVEQVLQDAWAASNMAGAALALASLAPTLLIAAQGRAAMPLVAFLSAASLAALLGAYPAILIGAGAAPILGMGLALAALKGQ